jgi:hypothetical protein
MRRSSVVPFVRACLLVALLAARPLADSPKIDFGLFVAEELYAHSRQFFGFSHPLSESAVGPYDGGITPRPSRWLRG